MEGRNWSMYGLAIDVTELCPQRTCGAQYTLYVMYKKCGFSIRTNRPLCETYNIVKITRL